jgi:hypothetical protein
MTITHLHFRQAGFGLQCIEPLDKDGLGFTERPDGGTDVLRANGNSLQLSAKFADILERMTAAGLVLQLESTAPVKVCNHFWVQTDIMDGGNLVVRGPATCAWCKTIKPTEETDLDNQRLRDCNEALRRTIRQQEGQILGARACAQSVEDVKDFLRKCGDPEIQDIAARNAPLLLAISCVVQIAVARGRAAMAEHKHNLELARRLDKLDAKLKVLQTHESAAVRMLHSIRGGLESTQCLVGATMVEEDLDNIRAWLRGTMAELDICLAIKPAADAPETDKPDNG